MVQELAKQIDSQMGMLANIMSSIAVVKKPTPLYNRKS